MNTFRVLPTRIHGVLDYSSVVLLAAIPFVVRANQRTRTLALGAAGKVLISGLMTRYELGLFKVFPMSAHLAVDFALGTALLGYAQGATEESGEARGALATLGVISVVASLITEETPGEIPDAFPGDS
ncbi:MAG: hypothetical protein SFU56_07440 [Capsulimonadales bacterium]|nr:hypothetical protein [Capsulimonadales bacterium]